MRHIKIFTIGKTKEAWLNSAVDLYLERLKGSAKISIEVARDRAQLMHWLEKEQNVICLDRQGPQMSSEQFSSWLLGKGARCSFVIGDKEGLPQELLDRYPSISFSKMVFTNQMIRLLLVEQIFRAFAIDRGSGYHSGS